MSKIKIGVFGSCPSRDIFNSSINENYKDYFSINLSYVNNSIISNMQEPVPYDKESIKILPDNKENQSHTSFIEKDLDKLFFDRLSKADIDYLLIDNGLEVKWGLVSFNNHIFFKYPRLDKTEFYNNIKNKRFITIQNNTNEFLKLFKESYTAFFDKMQKEYPNITVILNPVRERYKVLKSDGTIEVNENFKNRTDNQYLPLLDSYIAKKFDVEILNYNKNILLDENHKWGIGPKHYVKEYYEDYTNQIRDIVKRNEQLSSNDLNELNNKIRKERLNNHVIKAEYELELIENNKKLKSVDNYKKQLKDLKNNNNNLQDEVKKSNNKLQQLYDDCNNLNNQLNDINQKNQELNQKNQELIDKNNDLISKNDKLLQSNNDLNKKLEQLDDLQEEKIKLLSLRDKLVENNENLKLRNEKLNKTIESIYSSNSWKLTGSLRKIKKNFK